MGLLVHVVVYAAVNALLLLIWAAGGDERSVTDALSSPVAAVRDDECWPIWVVASWAVLLVVHAAVAAQVGRLRRRRRRRERREHRQLRGQAASAVPITGRRWIVALFTDLVGSSQLADSLGDDEWSEVIGRHRQVVRSLLIASDGNEVGTQGDGFLLSFERPVDAVRFAVALQRQLEADRERGRFTPPVRIGVHAGEAVGADDGDLIGRALNVASRVTALAGPGEILVTELIADQLGPDVRLEDRGLQELRGIGQHRHVLAVQWQEEPVPSTLDPEEDPA